MIGAENFGDFFVDGQVDENLGLIIQGLVFDLPSSRPCFLENDIWFSRNESIKWKINGSFSSQLPGSLNFNGINTYASIPRRSIPNLSEMTLNLWFNSNSSNFQNLVGEMGFVNGVFRNIVLQFGQVRWLNTFSPNLGSFSYNLNKWHYASFVLRKNTNGFEGLIFVDGILRDAQPAIGSVIQAGIFTEIGVESGNMNRFFSGKLGRISLYSRPLSAEEIFFNYNLDRSFYEKS